MSLLRRTLTNADIDSHGVKRGKLYSIAKRAEERLNTRDGNAWRICVQSNATDEGDEGKLRLLKSEASTQDWPDTGERAVCGGVRRLGRWWTQYILVGITVR